MHLVLPRIALAVVLRYPRDFTLFVSSSPRVDREGYVPSPSFLWLFGLEYLGFSPAFGAFVGPWLQFFQPSLYIGGFLFVATVAVELRASREWKYNFTLPLIPLLLASLLYGYVAARELDVVLDRSPDFVYRTEVSHKNATTGSRGLTIGPWAESLSDAMFRCRTACTGR